MIERVRVPVSLDYEPRRPAQGARYQIVRDHVDDVFPDVPVRQWVLSLPHRLRYQLAEPLAAYLCRSGKTSKSSSSEITEPYVRRW